MFRRRPLPVAAIGGLHGTSRDGRRFPLATWEGSMHSEDYLELHYDLLSHRALLSCGRKAYVLPDIYETKEMAQVAAQKFAWEKLGLKERAAGCRTAADLPVWLR
jgi:hypothetical protein